MTASPSAHPRSAAPVAPQADPHRYLPDVDPARIPRHIAFIMDGNGRWARAHGLPRMLGHRAGAATVRTIVRACGLLGVQYVTLYSFSLENWKRPAEEVQALMDLCIAYCEGQREELARENLRFAVIGRREGLPAPVLAALDSVSAATAHCTGPMLCLALNYSGRAELTDAARRLARDVAAGLLTPDAIDESQLQSRLYTAGIPDPDLLIRTAGEHRISNFLLWQISYAEIFVSDALWPDFTADHLHAAIRDYALRSRRFGGLDSVTPTPALPTTTTSSPAAAPVPASAEPSA